MTSVTARPLAYRSKTIATWLALVAGTLGLHRFYLHGFKDVWGWLHAVPTLIGIYGVERMQQLGQDDKIAWMMIPWLGLVLAASMLTAIRYGLTPDEKWNARFNGGRDASSGWAAVIAVGISLLIGGAVLMATIAFTAQRYFEYELEQETPASNG